MSYNIPLPRLIDTSGNTVQEFHPIKVSIDLNIIPLSTATMELPVNENLPARGYVELFTPLGSAGFYRVRSPEDGYGDEITRAELEHAVAEVGDYLVKNEYDEMMAAGTAMTTLFSYYGGSKWQLGSVSALGNGNVAVQVKYDRVLDAMLGIMDQKSDCMMTFDFSTTPWTIGFATRGTTVTAEGRLARNVSSARVVYDDTELCTRAYYERAATTDEVMGSFPAFDESKNFSKGAKVTNGGYLWTLTDGHVKDVTWANTTKVKVTDIPTTVWAYMDADTMSTYGLIEREVTTGSDYTQAEAEAAVTEYLRQHKRPRITIDIDGEELSAITGETLDTFTIGKLFRLALPDYNETVENNITGLSWRDVYNMPEDVNIRLGDEEDTAITFLHDVDSKGGSGGGGGGKKKEDEVFKEYRTRFEQTDYYFDLLAQRVNTAEEVLQQAGLYISSTGVLIYAQDNEAMLGSKIKAEADRISLVVEGYGANAHITPASIVLAINGQTGQSTVKLTANVIDIGGLITAINNQGESAVYISANLVKLDGKTLAERVKTNQLVVDQSIHTTGGSHTFEGRCDFPDDTHFTDANMSDGALTYGGETVTWKSATVYSFTFSNQHNFVYVSNGVEYNTPGYIIGTKSSSTIHYMGH